MNIQECNINNDNVLLYIDSKELATVVEKALVRRIILKNLVQAS